MTSDIFETFDTELRKHKIIAVLRDIDDDVILPLVEVLLYGGIKFIELPLSVNNVMLTHKAIAQVQRICEKFGDDVFVGAGTVMTENEAACVCEAGGKYVVSPNTDKNVICAAHSNGLVAIPGAFTPNEIVNAYKLGADYVKVFPAGNMGADYFKSVSIPLPHIPLLAVGGIKPNDAMAYIEAGAIGIGVAGNFTNREWLKNKEFDKIGKVAKEYIRTLK